MTTFLDMLYFLCCNFYKKREKDIFRVSGMILLTAVFGANVMFIFFMVSHFNSEALSTDDIYKSRYYIVGISMLIFMVLLYIRYFRITTYDEVYNRYHALIEEKRKTIHVLAFLYIVFSFAAMFGYAFYRAWLLSNWSH
jgi:hypothetical protein